MQKNKEKQEIAMYKRGKNTYSYPDMRKDFSLSTYFSCSESILDICKCLIRNEIINSHINNK